MRQKVVCNTSFMRERMPKRVHNTHLKLNTNFSQTTVPPECGTLCALSLHFIHLIAKSDVMLTLFHFLILSPSSFVAPIKLVQLSNQIMAGVPLRDKEFSPPIKQDLVSMDVPMLTWTARLVR